MKLLIFCVAMTFTTTTQSAQTESQYSELLNEIQNQITELHQLIDEVGRERIGDVYFQRLSESKVALAQLKAEPIENKVNFVELNQLSFFIDNIFHPENIETNQVKLERLNNRGSGGGGIIRGTVTYLETGEIATSVDVRLYDSNGNFFREDRVDIQGRYIFNNIIEGSYTTVAIPYATENIDTAQPNIACHGGPGLGCQIEGLPMLVLESNQLIEGVDIELQNKPVISGKVFYLENPENSVRYPRILIYDENGQLLSTQNGNYNGEYDAYFTGAGNYYLSVEHSDFQTQLYDGAICLDLCDFNFGTLLQMEENHQITNFDFNLTHHASISGTAVDSTTLEPFHNGRVYIYDEKKLLVKYDYINPTGEWQLSNIPVGDYKLVSALISGYVATIYDEVPCANVSSDSCDLSQGLTISHSGENIENIELKQIKGAMISGHVSDPENNHVGLIKMFLYDGLGDRVGNFVYSSQAYGSYQFNSLGNGTYYILAQSDDYQDELYSNITCSNSSCNILDGNPILIRNSQDVTNINFQINKSISIGGVVLDENSTPLDNIHIRAIDDETGLTYYDRTNSLGFYQFDRVSQGSYKVYSFDGNKYVSQAYDGIDCLGPDVYCENVIYTPLSIDENNINNINNVNFQLNKYGLVKFNIMSNSSNQIQNGFIFIYDDQGNYIRNGSIFDDFYLVDGDYYFVYQSYTHDNGFIDKVYGGTNCPNFNCEPTTGLLVSVVSNSIYELNMNIDEFFYIEFNFNEEINSVGILFYDENFDFYRNNSASNHERINIRESSPIYAEFYEDGYYSQVFENINCLTGQCDISIGTPIMPQINTSQTINFELDSSASISGRVFDSNGAPFVGVTVTLTTQPSHTSGGTRVVTSVNGEYVFNGVLPDEYYIIVNNYLQNDIYSITYYPNIACEINCQNMGISPVNVSVGAHLQDVDITLVANGIISGENIFNVYGEYVPSEIILYYYNKNQSTLVYHSIVEINSDGTIPLVYIPHGDYKLIIENNDSSNTNLKTAYPNTFCEFITSSSACAEMSTSLRVEAGLETHFNDFVVHQLGKIQGIVTNFSTGEFVNFAEIKFYKNSDGDLSGFDYTNNLGEYSKLLRSGGYKVFAKSDNNINQLYNEIDCFNGLGFDCQISDGGIINVDYDEKITINFSLKPNPLLKVTYRDKASLQILSSYINLYDADLNYIRSSNSSSTHIFDDLGSGEYYILIQPNLFNEGYSMFGYPDAICTEFNIASCDNSLAPINLSIENEVTEVLFSSFLKRGISGYVKDVNSGIPLNDMIIDIWNRWGTHWASTTTASNGGFSYPLSGGDYYISTDTNNAYINEVYQDIECESAAILGECDVRQGPPITLVNFNTVPIIIDVNLSKPDPVFLNGFE